MAGGHPARCTYTAKFESSSSSQQHHQQQQQQHQTRQDASSAPAPVTGAGGLLRLPQQQQQPSAFSHQEGALAGETTSQLSPLAAAPTGSQLAAAERGVACTPQAPCLPLPTCSSSCCCTNSRCSSSSSSGRRRRRRKEALGGALRRRVAARAKSSSSSLQARGRCSSSIKGSSNRCSSSSVGERPIAGTTSLWCSEASRSDEGSHSVSREAEVQQQQQKEQLQPPRERPRWLLRPPPEHLLNLLQREAFRCCCFLCSAAAAPQQQQQLIIPLPSLPRQVGRAAPPKAAAGECWGPEGQAPNAEAAAAAARKLGGGAVGAAAAEGSRVRGRLLHAGPGGLAPVCSVSVGSTGDSSRGSSNSTSSSRSSKRSSVTSSSSSSSSRGRLLRLPVASVREAVVVGNTSVAQRRRSKAADAAAGACSSRSSSSSTEGRGCFSDGKAHSRRYRVRLSFLEPLRHTAPETFSSAGFRNSSSMGENNLLFEPQCSSSRGAAAAAAAVAADAGAALAFGLHVKRHHHAADGGSRKGVCQQERQLYRRPWRPVSCDSSSSSSSSSSAARGHSLQAVDDVLRAASGMDIGHSLMHLTTSSSSNSSSSSIVSGPVKWLSGDGPADCSEVAAATASATAAAAGAAGSPCFGACDRGPHAGAEASSSDPAASPFTCIHSLPCAFPNVPPPAAASAEAAAAGGEEGSGGVRCCFMQGPLVVSVEESGGCVFSAWRGYLLIKRLNFILRHGAALFSLPMREDGFVRVRELLALPCMRSVTWDDLQTAVSANFKQRYELLFDEAEVETAPAFLDNEKQQQQQRMQQQGCSSSSINGRVGESGQGEEVACVCNGNQAQEKEGEGSLDEAKSFSLACSPPRPSAAAVEEADNCSAACVGEADGVSGKWLLRATQGHTIPYIRSDLLLRRVQHPWELPVCVHGTYLRNWMAIRVLGLHRMNRNHIHFATGLPGDASVVSGMRRNSEVAIYADVEKAMKAGVSFFKARNGVVLTDGIDGRMPPWLLSKVVLLKEGVTLLRDGVDLTQQHLGLIPRAYRRAQEAIIFKEQLQHDLDVLQLSPYAAPTCCLLNSHHSDQPLPICMAFAAQQQQQQQERQQQQQQQPYCCCQQQEAHKQQQQHALSRQAASSEEEGKEEERARLRRAQRDETFEGFAEK
ncbi:hypothetical protein Esti_003207 [Eimeria stiedai]